MCDVFLYFCHFPIGVLGQLWLLIVSIPDIGSASFVDHLRCLCLVFVMLSRLFIAA